LFVRFNETLSQYAYKARHGHKARRYSYKARRYGNEARRFVREHTRMSMAVAAVAAAATGIGVASAVGGSAPRAEVANSAAANYIHSGTTAGQSGGTVVSSAFGVHPESAGSQGWPASQQEPAQQQWPTQQQWPVQRQGLAQRQAPAQQAPAQRQASAKPQALTKSQTPSQPYSLYDSTEPYAVPAGQPVATYADGPFAVSPAEVAGHGQVLWIDTNGSDPQASALDVEPGDATPGIAAQWVQQKLTDQPTTTAIVYTSLSEWPEVQAAIGTLPSKMQSHVKYWVADPDGVPHMIPGASATQWYWGGSYDISLAEPGF
jgi:hypothetical protein